MDDYLLLKRLRRHLETLDRPGSEAELHMATWPHCIAGYALRLPVFNALGFRFVHGVPVFGSRTGMEAVEAFFGLTERQADYLFADAPERTGFDTVASFAEARRRITEITKGEI